MQNINTERGRLWVEALLSDEYRQAQDAFIDDAGHDVTDLTYCCLAVATDVAVKNGCEDVRWLDRSDARTPAVMIRWNEDMGDPEDYGTHETDDDGVVWVEDTTGVLPKPVSEWFGIVDDKPENPELDGHAAVTRNDSRGDDFATIARAIAVEIERVGS